MNFEHLKITFGLKIGDVVFLTHFLTHFLLILEFRLVLKTAMVTALPVALEPSDLFSRLLIHIRSDLAGCRKNLNFDPIIPPLPLYSLMKDVFLFRFIRDAEH